MPELPPKDVIHAGAVREAEKDPSTQRCSVCLSAGGALPDCFYWTLSRLADGVSPVCL